MEPDGQSVIPVSDRARTRVFVVLFLGIAITMVGVGIIAPFMPIYANELGASGLMVGAIFSGFSIARLFTMPFFGRWSDRKGRKAFIAAGFFVYAIVSVAFIFAQTAWQLLLIRVFQGACAAMILPIAMAYVGDISKKNHESRSMNWVNIALFLGFAVGPFSGGLIHDKAGMTANFASLGVASILAFFVVMAFLPDLKPNQKDGKPEEPARYRDILKNDTMKGLFAFRFGQALARGSNITFLPLFASAYLGLDAVHIGIILSLNLLFASLLQLVFARLADKYDRERMIVAGSVLGAITMVIIPFTHNFTELLIVNLGNGLAGALTLPAAAGMVVTEGRKFTMGSVMAVFNIAMSLGLASGPLISGLISDASNITNVFHFAAGMVMLGTVFFVLFLRRAAKYDTFPS